MQDPGARRGGQAAVAGLQGHAGHGDKESAPRETDPPVLGHVPADRRTVHEEASTRSVRNQSDGGADAQGGDAVLCVRTGEAEGALSQHVVL